MASERLGHTETGIAADGISMYCQLSQIREKFASLFSMKAVLELEKALGI